MFLCSVFLGSRNVLWERHLGSLHVVLQELIERIPSPFLIGTVGKEVGYCQDEVSKKTRSACSWAILHASTKLPRERSLAITRPVEPGFIGVGDTQ